MLNGNEKNKLLLYCTGGIRCEKASAYLIKHNFENVYQLKGGIIEYAHQIKEKKLTCKFKGKNFVFDAISPSSHRFFLRLGGHQCNVVSAKATPAQPSLTPVRGQEHFEDQPNKGLSGGSTRGRQAPPRGWYWDLGPHP